MLFQIETEVLGEGKEAPEGREAAAFGEGGDREIEEQDGEVCGEDAQRSFEIEFAIGYVPAAGDSREKLTADEKTAQDEKKVDACPSPATQCLAQTRRVAEHPIMIKENDDDSQRTEVIQAGESFDGGWRGKQVLLKWGSR